MSWLQRTQVALSENHPKIQTVYHIISYNFPESNGHLKVYLVFNHTQMARFHLLCLKSDSRTAQSCSNKEDNIPGYAGVVRTSKPLDMVSAKLLMEQRGFVVFRKLGRDKFLTCAYLSRNPSQHLDVFDVSFSVRFVPAVRSCGPAIRRIFRQIRRFSRREL